MSRVEQLTSQLDQLDEYDFALHHLRAELKKFSKTRTPGAAIRRSIKKFEQERRTLFMIIYRIKEETR